MAPTKTLKIKNNSQEWFDQEVAEKIKIREKCCKKFKKSKLHVDREIFKKSQKVVRDIIKQKKKAFIESKLNKNIGKPKEVWKTLKT